IPDLLIECHPGMPRSLPDRSRWRWKTRISKSTNENSNQTGTCVCLAIYGGPACRTKMQPKFAAFLAVTDVDLTRSMGMNLGFREERANAKYRPRPSLAFAAITNMDQDRFAVCLCLQRTAATMSNSSHVPSFLRAAAPVTIMSKPRWFNRCVRLANSERV